MTYILIFPSDYFVMKGEKILKNKGLNTRLIPVPRKISSDCGMALEVLSPDIKSIKKFLEEGGCKLTEVYDDSGKYRGV